MSGCLNNFEQTGSGSKVKIIAFLKEQNPDILCLQEFFTTGNPSLDEASFRKNWEGNTTPT
jgi:exonuclease III